MTADGAFNAWFSLMTTVSVLLLVSLGLAVVGVIPTMGQLYVARSFMAVIVGGPAFLAGTAGASTALGAVENLVSRSYTPVIGQAMLLVAAIVILRFLPQGLTGRHRRGGLV